MTPTIIEEYILPTLTRYIDQYRWSWSRAARIINLYYGTVYTEKELKRLYKRSK